MAQALVPLKDLVRAKTRLAGLLAPSERRALAQAMVEDVLALLAVHPGVDSINLVSDDPSAHLLAAQYGARHWPESELGCRGLNNIIGSASRRLLALRDEPVLVLHADLPLLGPEDVSAVLAARQRTGGLVIARARIYCALMPPPCLRSVLARTAVYGTSPPLAPAVWLRMW